MKCGTLALKATRARETLLDGDGAMKFNHVGIPTMTRFEGEINLST